MARMGIHDHGDLHGDRVHVPGDASHPAQSRSRVVGARSVRCPVGGNRRIVTRSHRMGTVQSIDRHGHRDRVPHLREPACHLYVANRRRRPVVTVLGSPRGDMLHDGLVG